MRFLSVLALSFLLFLSVFCVSSANASPSVTPPKTVSETNDTPKPKPNSNSNSGSTIMEGDDDEDVVLLVKYLNEKGRDDLKLVATDGKIRTDMKTFKIAVIQAKRSKIDEIANDPNIKAVSVDQVVYALEEEEDEEKEDL